MTLFEELEWLRAFIVALMLVAAFAVVIASLALLELHAIRRWVEDHPDFAFAPRNMRPLKASLLQRLLTALDEFGAHRPMPPTVGYGANHFALLRQDAHVASPPLQPPQSEP